jgi:GTPase SAR1 family protein
LISIYSVATIFPQRDELFYADKELIFEGLKDLYEKKVLPLEKASKYSQFGSPPLSPSDFNAKPMVLIIGQYSVGKTSFIRSLLGQDFPGQRIGPEPTTDRFTALMHQSSDSSQSQSSTGRLIPGHALVMENNKPFQGLATYGNNFLSKFEGCEVYAPILRNLTIVDTPGVLAGEKQRIGRDYDFSEVIKWFADRADMIIVMFDAHKLDISDELKSVLDTLKPHQEKIRVLLNKADSLDAQSLLRVYGALMWSLGKVIQTPEVCRVYMSSFWDQPLKATSENRLLLERERQDLLQEMLALPQNAVIRRINELVKRARSVKVHAYIVHYLRKQMPYMLGKVEKQRQLLDSLEHEFLACARRYNLPIGDFPSPHHYRKILAEIRDITEVKKLDKNLVYEMEKVLTHDIPKLLQKANANIQQQQQGRSKISQTQPVISPALQQQQHGYNTRQPPPPPQQYQPQYQQQQHNPQQFVGQKQQSQSQSQQKPPFSSSQQQYYPSSYPTAVGSSSSTASSSSRHYQPRSSSSSAAAEAAGGGFTSSQPSAPEISKI